MNDILKIIKLKCNDIIQNNIIQCNSVVSLHIPEKIFSKLKPSDLKYYTENEPFNYGYINGVQIVFNKFLSNDMILAIYEDHHIEKIKITYE